MNLTSLFSGFLTVIMSLLITFSFTNCGQEMESNTAGDIATIVYLGSDGRPMETKLPYEVKGSDVIVQGDIIVGQKPELQNGNKFIVNFARSKFEDFGYKLGLDNANGKQLVALHAVKDQFDTNWPGGIVPVEIKKEVPELRRVIRLMDSFNQLMVDNNIQVKLIVRTNEQSFVTIKSEYDSCSASAGYSRFSYINLGAGCISQRVIHHEILHVLGFKHEQSRSDRNEHVIIKEENIIDGKARNFIELINSFNYTGYDFDSIMHYDGHAFSKNGEPTIVRRHSNEPIVAKNQLSKGDIAGLKELYEVGAYTNVEALIDNPKVLDILESISNPVTFQPIAEVITDVVKPPIVVPEGPRLLPEVILPVAPDVITVFPNPASQAGELPPGLIEGRQYIAEGFASKVYRHTSGTTCRVPDGHFKEVIQKPKSWINQLIAQTKQPPELCDMKTVSVAEVRASPVQLPAGLLFNQQYIARGFVSKVLKITKSGVCQVPDGHFYEVKEIPKSQIKSILELGGQGFKPEKCAIN